MNRGRPGRASGPRCRLALVVTAALVLSAPGDAPAQKTPAVPAAIPVVRPSPVTLRRPVVVTTGAISMTGLAFATTTDPLAINGLAVAVSTDPLVVTGEGVDVRERDEAAVVRGAAAGRSAVAVCITARPPRAETESR